MVHAQLTTIGVLKLANNNYISVQHDGYFDFFE